MKIVQYELEQKMVIVSLGHVEIYYFTQILSYTSSSLYLKVSMSNTRHSDNGNTKHSDDGMNIGHFILVKNIGKMEE